MHQRPEHRKTALHMAICRHKVRSESTEEPKNVIIDSTRGHDIWLQDD